MKRKEADDIKIVIEQCQYCKYWDVEEGYIHPDAKDTYPIEDCGCLERQDVSQYGLNLIGGI